MSTIRVLLAERIQSIYGKSVENGVVSKEGPDHNPIITVFYILPNGKRFEKTGIQGQNKKLVLEDLAKEIFEEEDLLNRD